MIPYLTSIDTFSQSCSVFKEFDFKVFRYWSWPLTFRGQKYFYLSKDHSWFPVQLLLTLSIHLIQFLRYISGFDLDFWPLESKIFFPFESSYVTSYLTSIDTSSLSFAIFETFDFKLFMANLAFDLQWSSEVNFHSLFESSYKTP